MPILSVPHVDDDGECPITGLRGNALRGRERLAVHVSSSSEDVSLTVAHEIAHLIRRRAAEGGKPPVRHANGRDTFSRSYIQNRYLQAQRNK
jgi:hypothetical protein